MKKKLLLFFFAVFSVLTVSAQLSQPSQFNNMCDDNNDGFATFYMQEIAFEIIGNNQNLVVTHHLTQADAMSGANPLPNTYTNVTSPQLIFARIYNTATTQYDILTYELTVYSPPLAPNQMISVCSNAGQCVNLEQVTPLIIAGNPGWIVLFFETQSDAMAMANPIANPTCYSMITAAAQPIYYSVFNPNSPNCSSVGMVNLVMITCETPGQPQSLTACAEGSNNVCYDLSVNNDDVMGTLDPMNHSVSYHVSEADAVNGVNAIITNPYCVSQGFHLLYSRVQTNAGQLVQINSFALNGFNFQHNMTPLQTMVQCDDNQDQMVVFNLTTAQAQINTTNTLTYYLSSTDAQSETNPIATPSAHAVSIFQPTTSVFIRETIVGECDVIYSLPLQTVSNCNLASSCILANSLCNALGVPFSNSVNTNINEPNANYGCLNTHPNPTWFYMPISSSGVISLMVTQTMNNGQPIDVDYIVYGPFTSPTTPCYNQLTPNFIVSCSYSAAAVEYPIIPNAVSGQYYLIMVTNFSNQPGMITISEQGNSQGQIDCSGLHLNAFLDSNSNNIQDNGEVNFPLGQFQYELNNNGTVHNIVSPAGSYNIYDLNPANSYDISFSVNPNYAAMYGVTTPSYNNVSIVVGGGMITYNFPVTIVQSYSDIAVTIIPSNAPRPGFTYLNKVLYTNLGNQTVASGTVTFNNDADVTITSISQAGTTPTATGFTYGFTNLLPFESRTIDVTMQVPTIPTVNAGDYLTNTASIEPLAGDVVPENNASSNSQMIINAYDPNDKMEAHGDKILFSSFSSSDYLYYTIRFENTGNASAINVRVNDMLNDQLDENTLQMVSASHPYILDRVDNDLTWRFDNIQLPVSIPNTNTGKGSITFKVKPKAGFAVGDIIPNAASIYFDFNPAIITNTFTTEFIEQLGTVGLDATSFAIHPNPSSETVFVTLNSSSENIEKIQIVDMLGKIVMTSSGINSNQAQLNIESVSPGIYLVEVTSENGLKAVKKLIVK